MWCSRSIRIVDPNLENIIESFRRKITLTLFIGDMLSRRSSPWTLVGQVNCLRENNL
jgi:hypothetical protein